MGSIDPPRGTKQGRFGRIKYRVPNLDIRAEQRSFFGLPPSKEEELTRVELHDMRSSSSIASGGAGLDVQGFTVVNHKSALSVEDGPQSWFEGQNVEEKYFPELEALLLDLLPGSKKVVVGNVAMRRKVVTNQHDPNWYPERGGDFDKMISEQMPRDRALVTGKSMETSIEPVRPAHIDYTLQSLRDTARWCRKDMKAAAQPALDAEDAGAADVPRYAAFSVWRPLKTVKRDPLAMCDWRTINPQEDLCPVAYRHPSGVTETGEYMNVGWYALPPKEKDRHIWYWLPEQRDDEVLVIKLADTASDGNAQVASGGLHAAADLEGAEIQEARESIEARVLVFW